MPFFSPLVQILAQFDPPNSNFLLLFEQWSSKPNPRSLQERGWRLRKHLPTKHPYCWHNFHARTFEIESPEAPNRTYPFTKTSVGSQLIATRIRLLLVSSDPGSCSATQKRNLGRNCACNTCTKPRTKRLALDLRNPCLRCWQNFQAPKTKKKTLKSSASFGAVSTFTFILTCAACTTFALFPFWSSANDIWPSVCRIDSG